MKSGDTVNESGPSGSKFCASGRFRAEGEILAPVVMAIEIESPFVLKRLHFALLCRRLTLGGTLHLTLILLNVMRAAGLSACWKPVVCFSA